MKISDINYNLIIPTITRPIISFPFDLFVIKKQLVPNKSYLDIFSSLKNENIILKKFLLIHWIELISKSSVYSVYYYSNKYAKNFDISNNYKFIPDLFSVSCIGLCDIFIINPFERIKVSILNNLDYKFRNNNFFQNSKWLMVGASLTFTTSFLHVGTFITLNNLNKKIFGLENKKITISESILIGGFTSIVQSAITYPIISLRTKFQNINLTQNINLKKYLLNKKNYIGLYSGFTSRFLRGFLIVMFDTYWINNL